MKETITYGVTYQVYKRTGRTGREQYLRQHGIHTSSLSNLSCCPVMFPDGRFFVRVSVAVLLAVYRLGPNIKTKKIHSSSCEIEDFVETHLCKLCVILRSRVLLGVCPQ